jgi:hypothetical protein
MCPDDIDTSVPGAGYGKEWPCAGRGEANGFKYGKVAVDTFLGPFTALREGE